MDVGWRNIPFRKRFWRSSHGEIEFAWGKGYITIHEMESTMDGANLKDWERSFIWRDQTCELRKTNKHSINEHMTNPMTDAMTATMILKNMRYHWCKIFVVFILYRKPL